MLSEMKTIELIKRVEAVLILVLMEYALWDSVRRAQGGRSSLS